MPDYTIRDPRSGRRVTVRGDSPPTEAELQQIFSKVNADATRGHREQAVMLESDPAFIKDQSDFVTGIGKGVANTAIGATDYITRIPGLRHVAEAVSGLPQQQMVSALRANFATPTNDAQQSGMTAEQVAEFMVPLGGQAKAAQVASRAPAVVRGLSRMVGEGGEFAAKTAVQGGDADAIATNAAIGAAVPVAGAALSGARRVATEKLPERLYGQIFKSSADDMRQQYQALAEGSQNPMLAREVMERGISGTSEQMAVESIKRLDDLESQLQAAAKGHMVPLSPNKPRFISLLKKIESTFDNTFFSDRAAEASDLAARLNATRGGAVSAEDALRLKRFLDRMRNTSSFKLDPKLTTAQEELKVAADTVRSALKQNKTFEALLNEERVYIQAVDDIVDDAVRRNNKQLLGLTDYILGGGGVAAGADLAGVGAAATVRAFQQPTTLTGIGQVLHRTGTAVPRGVGGPAARGVAATARQREDTPR